MTTNPNDAREDRIVTPAERKARFDALETIGCCVCRLRLNKRTRPAIHHLRGSQYGTGTGLKARDEMTIGLCPVHHQDGGYGVAYHAGPGAFEERYGTQAELLEWTNEQIAGRSRPPTSNRP